jgi:hypothetical protein
MLLSVGILAAIRGESGFVWRETFDPNGAQLKVSLQTKPLSPRMAARMPTERSIGIGSKPLSVGILAAIRGESGFVWRETFNWAPFGSSVEPDSPFTEK